MSKSRKIKRLKHELREAREFQTVVEWILSWDFLDGRALPAYPYAEARARVAAIEALVASTKKN